MATGLLKPLDKKREYTAEYLATLPTFTGQQPEMITLEIAEKRRRQHDMEQLKFTEDHRAGRIDQEENRLAPDSEDGGTEHGSIAS